MDRWTEKQLDICHLNIATTEQKYAASHRQAFYSMCSSAVMGNANANKLRRWMLMQVDHKEDDH